MGTTNSFARRFLKGCVGEWGYRQLREWKNQCGNPRLARLLATLTPTAFPPQFTDALGTLPEPSDIVDHLGTLFFHTVSRNAQLVVELGTRGGESTRALLAAVRMTGGRVLSLDIDDCTGIGLPDEMKRRWQFIKTDDVAFGRNEFAGWCRNQSLGSDIDVLFIDTSHLYEHTLQEIDAWHGYVRPGGVMIFHDTNMGEGIYRRRDGTFGDGWDNQRGVIKAIEEFLGTEYNEHASFVDIARGWIVSHDPYCNGLTVMLRCPAPTNGAMPPNNATNA